MFDMSIINEVLGKIHALSEKHKIWLDVIFLLFCVAYVLAGLSLVPFHGDESAYLILSEDYDKVFKKHEVEKILFDPDGKSKQYLRLSTGESYLFLLGLRVTLPTMMTRSTNGYGDLPGRITLRLEICQIHNY